MGDLLGITLSTILRHVFTHRYCTNAAFINMPKSRDLFYSVPIKGRNITLFDSPGRLGVRWVQ